MDRILDLVPPALTLLILSWTAWLVWAFIKPRNHHSLRSVAVLVLGDIGRSPRMMYHAQSFAENDFVTDIIGYGGSKPIPALERLPKARLRYLPEPPHILKSLPFILFAPIKILHQIIAILFVLTVQIAVPPEFILVQNPPTIPTLAIVWLVGRIRGSKVIIDWHNLGYTILALKLGEKHPFVKVAAWFEAWFGRSAYAHLFVTQAMHDFLVTKWDLQGRMVVLHDRPPHHFHRSSAQETHELFRRLEPSLTLQESLSHFLPESSVPYSTPFTHTSEDKSSKTIPAPSTSVVTHDILAYRAKSATPTPPPISATAPTYSDVGLPTPRPDRPALLVSSTSWTPDEDFGILLEAMGIYETRAKELAVSNGNGNGAKEGQVDIGKLPKLLVILTGKGPLRDKYMKEVQRLQSEWEWVRCISLWLEAEDYPILLGSADLGVCLHSSSSELDLPMKVVDMFGCGLPVCALDFACLHELVKDEVNGLIFKDAPQLARQLETLFTSFPNSSRLEVLRSSLLKTSQPSPSPNIHSGHHVDGGANWHWDTWEESWSRLVKPLILSDMSR